VADDKRVAVILDAVTAKYEAGMFRAAGATKAFAANAEVQVKKVGQSWDKFAGSSSKNLDKVGKVGLVVGGGIAAAFGLAAYAAMNFDKQMSEVGAVANASAQELGMLRQAALDAGAATVFSASEAAQAQAELAKAGVATQDILSGGLMGALNLASAGSLDLATAATYAANAMNTFKLQGADVPRIADTLAAGANKSAADVDQMGQSLQQTGLVADQMGLTLEDTVGVLSMFAQAGLKGSDAGTSLKTMLMRLTPSSKEAKDAMESLGLSFYDAQGNFVGISTAAEQLKTKLAPLTQEQRQLALQTIFGADAIRAATILYQSGGQGVDQWTDAVSESGYAAELAAKKNDNLAGDLEQLKGSLETALIQTGSQATGVLRGIAQGLTGVVNGLGEMPAPLQTAFAGSTGVIGLAAAAAGAFGTFAPKVRDLKGALAEMGPTAQFVGRNFGNIAKNAAIATTALAVIAQMFDAASAGAKDAQKIFDGVKFDSTSAMSMGDALAQLQTQYDTLAAKQDKQSDGILDMGSAFLDVVVPIHNVEGSLVDTASAVDDLDERMNKLRMDQRHLADVSGAVAGALGLTIDEAERLVIASDVDLMLPFPKAVEGVKAYHSELTVGTPAAQGFAGSIEGVGDATQSSEEKLRDLTDALKSFLDMAFGQEEATDAITRKMADLAEAAKEGKLAFEGNSEGALDFREKMRDVANGVGDLVTEWAEMGVQGDDLRTRIFLLSQDLIAQAVAMGVPRAEAERYFGQLNNLPADVFTEISQPGMPGALADTETLNGQLAVAALGASGIIALPNIDGSIRLTNELNEELGVVKQGASGPVSVPGADGSTYQVSLVNGQLQVVKQGAHGVVTVDTAGAVNSVQSLLNKLHDASSTINGTYGRGLGFMLPQVEPQANGGILNFANGGFGENHVAQFARAGAMRLWAEPETGGEAYIPLHPSKRARSVSIWEQTGRLLGAGMGSSWVVNVDARGSTLSEAQITAAVMRAAPALSEAHRKADRSRT
jgi:TP901 family phage tail tape measure protein